MARTGPRSTTATLAIAMTATVVCALPLFLTGAQAVEMRTELGFSATGLGVAVSAYRANAAITSGSLGRYADRVGATMAIRLGVAIAGAASLAIALFARNWWLLVTFMFLAGAGQALCQPAANRMLINRVPRERQGFAFGIKQSAPPTASMLAGISVPIIALTVGWRWAFALVPALALLVAVGTGSPVRRTSAASGGRALTGSKLSSGKTMMLRVSFGLAAAGSSTVPAFYVDAAVSAGTSNDLAGTILAGASAGAIAVRVIAGIACDRMLGRHMLLAAGLVGAGSLGLALLAVGTPVSMGIGVAIALAGTWGFNGVFWYALMRAFPDTPGATTGAIAPGGLIGGIVGPIAFGALVDGASYPLAWSFSVLLAVCAAAAMTMSARRLAR